MPANERDWNHILCERCYFSKSSAIPHRLKPDWDTCCRCGARTKSGIVIRANPAAMTCEGRRGTHVSGAVARG
jgi:hypothetical protein